MQRPCLCFVQVFAGPGEAIAGLYRLKPSWRNARTSPHCRLMFEELDQSDFFLRPKHAEDHAECRCRLAAPIAGVDQHQSTRSRFASSSCLVRILQRVQNRLNEFDARSRGHVLADARIGVATVLSQRRCHFNRASILAQLGSQRSSARRIQIASVPYRRPHLRSRPRVRINRQMCRAALHQN